jgi:hypothetical protein
MRNQLAALSDDEVDELDEPDDLAPSDLVSLDELSLFFSEDELSDDELSEDDEDEDDLELSVDLRLSVL